MTLSVLHLSDFHVGKDEYGQLSLFETILQQVRDRLAGGNRLDYVVITGDIANRGQDSEYGLFLASFLDPLRTALGESVPLLIVPGNHDIDRQSCPTTVSYSHADEHPEYFDPTPKGYGFREPSLPRLAAYHRFLEAAGLEEQRFDGEKPYYAVTFDVAGGRLGVVGLNSAWLSQDPVGRGTHYVGKDGTWDERERLTPGVAALRAGLGEVAGCDVRIVLCHHPISWFRLEEQDRSRALLGQSRAIFAHGHLHRTQSQLSEGAGLLFRALQAGAAFQARDDSRWRNRFCWYEIEPISLEVSAEPLSWDADQNSWVIDGDAFPPLFRKGNHWSLPGIRQLAGAGEWTPPLGCAVVTPDFLQQAATPVTDDDLGAFFDGAIPTWRLILSDRVPVRAPVARLVNDFSGKADTPGLPMIRLISGAGGEGKSTILLQTARALVASAKPWRLLHVGSHELPLTAQDILGLPGGSAPWLVVADDAEDDAKVFAAAAKSAWESGRKDLHFLLAARDTDWKAIGADKERWHEYSDFEELKLRGLSTDESQAIVDAWKALGKRGLGQLADVAESERAGALFRAVTVPSPRREGSFFGGALELRFGKRLREHVRTVLTRLSERTVNREYSLMDALVMIAAPHSINVLTLSPAILEEALGTSPIETRRRIIIPLGEEAAAARDGRFLLTRHRAFAQSVMEVAQKHFGVDDGWYFETLVRAVHRLRPKLMMPGFNDFRYLSQRFRERLHRPKLAIRLAEVLVEAEPRNRHYLQELGVCFGENGCSAANVCTCLASLADYPHVKPPPNNQCKAALAGIGCGLGNLWDGTNNHVFAAGMAAVVNLGYQLHLDPVTKGYFKQYDESLDESVKVTLDSSIEVLIEAAEITWEMRECETPAAVRRPSDLKFSGLARACGVALR